MLAMFLIHFSCIALKMDQIDLSSVYLLHQDQLCNDLY